MAIATFRTFVGVAKETTPGTAVSPTDYITITGDPKGTDTYKKLDDKSFRGSAVATYAKIPAMRTGELSLDGNVNPATIGYFLGSLLPDVTSAATATPSGLAAAASGTGSSFGAGAQYWVITAVYGTGESMKSNEVTLTLTAGQNVNLTWTAVPGASAYNIYRGTAAGAENKLVGTAGTASFTDTGAAGTSATPPATSTAPATSHAFSCKNSGDSQPTSFTFTDFDGDQARAFAGSKVSDLSLKWSADGLLTFTSKVSSWASTTITTPTPSYSTVLPIAAFTGALYINGSKSVVMESGSLDIKRKVEYLQTVQNTQDPYALFSGAVAVTGKLTTVLLASDPILAKIGNSSAAGSLDAYQLSFSQGNTTLVLQLSNVVYTKVAPVRGKDYVQLDVEFEGVGNTTDVGASGGYSPIKAFVANGVAAGTYQ